MPIETRPLPHDARVVQETLNKLGYTLAPDFFMAYGSGFRFERPEPQFGATGTIAFFISPILGGFRLWWESHGWRKEPGGFLKYWIEPVASWDDVKAALEQDHVAVKALAEHVLKSGGPMIVDAKADWPEVING